MARSALRYPDNVPGDWYVDQSCIDCGACRVVAPSVFGDAQDHARVIAVPHTPEIALRAAMALCACPVGAIGTEGKADLRAAAAAFPDPVLPDVYHLGFADRQSYGASSWLLCRPEGNVMVDVPRPIPALLQRIAALGGVRWLFLTHRDDVGSHQKIVDFFGARRILHVGDRDAAPAEWLIDSDTVQEDLRFFPTPGHTRGSMCLLWRDVLFSGDHFWGDGEGGLDAGRSVCWYNWAEQTRSMDRLLDLDFAHVQPGHGRPWHGTVAGAKEELRRLLGRMRGEG